MIDSDKRAKLASLKRQIKEIEAPEREARKIARAKAKRRRESGLSRGFGQREPRVKDPAYLRWIRRQPCACCGKPGPNQAAHIRSGYPEAGWPATGMQEKPSDHRVASLCRACHLDGPNAQHRQNERAFWASLNIYPPALCASLREAYEAERNRHD